MVRNRSTLIDLGGETLISPQPPDAPGPGATNKIVSLGEPMHIGVVGQSARIVVTTTGAGDGFPVYSDRQATINPGDDIDTVINSFSPGTLFGFAGGVHLVDTAGKQYSPRPGDRFVGPTDASGIPLAIIRGNWPGTQGGTGIVSPFPFANTGLYPANVQLLRLDFSFFASPTQQAALNGGDSWRIHKCHIHDMLSWAVRVGDNAIVSGGKCFHNGQGGFKSKTAGHDGTLDGVEIYENNFANWNGQGGEAGGIKFIGQDPEGYTVRNCHVHHNQGNGIWYDDAGANSLIEDNISEFNTRNGIFYEISTGNALIQRNTCRMNGGAGEIYQSSSRGFVGNPIVIRDNIVGPHANPNVATIACNDQVGRLQRLGYTRIENNQVIDEDILVAFFSDTTGIDPSVTGAQAPGIEIVGNDYFSDTYVSSGAGWQYGNGQTKTWAQWQALGFDLTGTRNPAP